MIVVNFGLKSISTEKTMSGSELLADPNFKAVLGYGDNIEIFQDGVLIPNSAQLVDGATYALNTKSCAKGK